MPVKATILYFKQGNTADLNPRYRRFGACILGCLLLLAGCEKSNEDTSTSNAQSVLDMGIGAEPRDLDPHLVTGIPEFQVLLALFEGLVRPGPTDAVPVVPGAAESWTLSEDGTRYHFVIRADAKWSNGDPLLADHFVYAAKRVLDPGLGSPHAEWLYGIRGAEDYHRGEAASFQSVGITAISDRGLEIDLEKPIPYFLELLKHPAWYPVHPDTIRNAGADKSATTGWARPGTLVGNGPYTLTNWRNGSHIEVVQNPHYEGHEPTTLESIRFYPIDNTNTEELGFRTGQLDITDDVPFLKRSAYRQREDPAYREYPVLATTYLVFNTSKAPLDDPRVRRALSLAIDRLSITENIVHTGKPATGFVPAVLPDYESDALVGYRVEEARRLLTEAGYPDGEGFPVLDYSLSNSDTSREVAVAVQNMWRQVLNIHVRLVNSEFRVMLDRLNRGNFQLGYLAWYADFVDPYAFLGMMRADGASNRSNWSHSEYERLLEESQQSNPAGKRLKILKDAEGILLQEAPIAPVYWVTTSRLVNPRLNGWEPRLMDLHPFQYLSFQEASP